MRPEFEKYNLIDNYLSGKLSEQENSAFEQSMAEDSSLREDVFDRKVVNEIIIEKRFFDITAGLRVPASGTRALLSKSVKRYVGIGAAVSVILFTPYYFSKRAEEPTEKTTTGTEQKSEPAEILAPVAQQEEQADPALVYEEQTQENTERVEPTIEEQPVVEEIVVKEKTPVVKPVVIAKKKKAKSSILEIPIDDPSAKGQQANSFTFNPAKGQSWKIPMHNHKEAKVTIFNKEGNEVFTSNLEQGKNTNWKGISTDGVKQKAGKYAYLLDFGNGKIEHGHVTINP